MDITCIVCCAYELYINLRPYYDDPVYALSGGEKQMNILKNKTNALYYFS